MKPSEIFEGENSGLRKAFDEAVAREQSYAEKQIDEIIEKVRTVEFLHGVPVTLPSETIELLRSGIRGAITQALAEERARVVMEIRKRMPSHDAVMEYLSSLDKPIDKPKSMWGGPGCGYMMGQGSILDLSGGGSGYGTCGNCGGVVDEPLSSLDKLKEI